MEINWIEPQNQISKSKNGLALIDNEFGSVINEHAHLPQKQKPFDKYDSRFFPNTEKQNNPESNCFLTSKMRPL
jgi:hypothetical protein